MEKRPTGGKSFNRPKVIPFLNKSYFNLAG